MAMQTRKKGDDREVKRDVALLRSFVIGMAGKDKEGKYRPEFVRKMMRLATERPTHVFKGKNDFLEQVKKAPSR